MYEKLYEILSILRNGYIAHYYITHIKNANLPTALHNLKYFSQTLWMHCLLLLLNCSYREKKYMVAKISLYINWHRFKFSLYETEACKDNYHEKHSIQLHFRTIAIRAKLKIDCFCFIRFVKSYFWEFSIYLFKNMIFFNYNIYLDLMILATRFHLILYGRLLSIF